MDILKNIIINIPVKTIAVFVPCALKVHFNVLNSPQIFCEYTKGIK
jgi:hypothetical protein